MYRHGNLDLPVYVLLSINAQHFGQTFLKLWLSFDSWKFSQNSRDICTSYFLNCHLIMSMLREECITTEVYMLTIVDH